MNIKLMTEQHLVFLSFKGCSGFIQASLSKIKDFTRTTKDYPSVFKDLKFMKNPHLSVKILFQKC